MPLPDASVDIVISKREFEQSLRAAGLDEVDIAETHRVHAHAASAIIRARRPA